MNNFQPVNQSYLDLQYNFLIAHQEELKQKFNYWKNEFELGTIFNNPNFKLKKSLSSIITKLKTNLEDNKTKPRLKKIAKQNKKTENITLTEGEVDAYLLKNFFNVDLSLINNTKSK